MRATLPLPPGRMPTDLLPNRAERRHPRDPKRRTKPSRVTLAAGFSRSSQRTHEAPRTVEDWARIGAAERKRVRKLRAKGLYDGPEIMADAVVVLPPDAEVSYVDLTGKA